MSFSSVTVESAVSVCATWVPSVVADESSKCWLIDSIREWLDGQHMVFNSGHFGSLVDNAMSIRSQYDYAATHFMSKGYEVSEISLYSDEDTGRVGNEICFTFRVSCSDDMFLDVFSFVDLGFTDIAPLITVQRAGFSEIEPVCHVASVDGLLGSLLSDDDDVAWAAWHELIA